MGWFDDSNGPAVCRQIDLPHAPLVEQVANSVVPCARAKQASAGSEGVVALGITAAGAGYIAALAAALAANFGTAAVEARKHTLAAIQMEVAVRANTARAIDSAVDTVRMALAAAAEYKAHAAASAAESAAAVIAVAGIAASAADSTSAAVAAVANSAAALVAAD